MRKKILSVVLIVSTITAKAQTWQDTVLLLDKIMARYADKNPGAQVAISRNGQIVYSSARGMAHLEHNVPLTKESKMEAGSVSKQFTAAAVLLLEQQGKLSVNDDVRKYVPEVPVYGYTITLRHLLNHTSGIKDWGTIADITGWPRGTKAYSNDDALQFISMQKTLNNKPGDEYIYSNSNYNLLAIILQRVSGISLSEFSKKYIFEPVGMNNTEWRDNYRKVVLNRATAYSKSGNNYVTNMPNENAYGNGGLLTTAEDLLLWNNFYLAGKLGSPSLLSKQISVSPLNIGKRNSYASGLFVDSVNGWSAIRHDGATGGYRSNLEHFPQLGLSLAWISNTSQGDMGNVPFAIRNLLVKNLTPSLTNTAPASTMDIKSFLPYLGSYSETKTGNGLKVYKNDTALFIQGNIRLVPVAANAALLGRGRLEFKSANPRLIHYITPSNDTTVYYGADSSYVLEKKLQDYFGTYYSDEAEAKLKIVVKDGKVFGQQRGYEFQLSPVYKDGFSIPGGDLYFDRDKTGKISKFFISYARARKVEFKKLPAAVK